MISQKDFESYLRNHIPFFVYNPQGLKDISLIKAVVKAGGLGLINFERIDLKEMQEIFEKCCQELVHSFGVRVNSIEQLDVILNLYNNNEPLIIIIGDFQLNAKMKEKIQQKPIILFAEVTSLAEAYEKKWARAFVLKGIEAAGRVSDETTFILCQQFANTGLSFIPQGGLGLFTTAAVFGVGAKAVVFDTQVYLMKDCPLNSETKHFLSTLDSTDTKIIGNSCKMKYRVYGKLGTRIFNDFLKKEKDLLSLSIDERTIELKKRLFENRAMFNA